MPLKRKDNSIEAYEAVDGNVKPTTTDLVKASRNLKKEPDVLHGNYSSVPMPSYQTYTPGTFSNYSTYTPTQFTGYSLYKTPTDFTNYQTYTPTEYTNWQQYTATPYAGYSGGDFSYDPFQYDQFSYNYQDDPLYQQYAEQYTRRGQQAYDDALTRLSARTGGVSNSYSEAAAQNEYNTYMAALADKIPELQQIARSMYDTDRNFAYNQYQDDRQTAYDNYMRRYNEDYNNWQNEQNIANANVDLANQYGYANWQAQEAARQAAIDLANQYNYANWQNQQNIANANVDLANQYNLMNWQTQEAARQAAIDQANQYNYANWQAQEKARQANVDLANDWALKQWQNDQSANAKSINDALAKLQAENEKYQQNLSGQTKINFQQSNTASALSANNDPAIIQARVTGGAMGNNGFRDTQNLIIEMLHNGASGAEIRNAINDAATMSKAQGGPLINAAERRALEKLYSNIK